MKRFLIDINELRRDRVRLTGREAHHARHVLRLPVGAEVLLMDGLGGEYSARITEFDRFNVELVIGEKRDAVGESPLDLTLAVGILKPEAMDSVIRTGTELGLASLIPLVTENTDIRLNSGQIEKRMVRWRRIARQSIKQCRRGRPMAVRPVTTFQRFLQELPAADLKLMLDPYGATEKGRDLRSLIMADRPVSSILALVGPEGGLTPVERDRAIQAGLPAVNAGPRILRAETATLALCAILGTAFGDIT